MGTGEKLTVHGTGLLVNLVIPCEREGMARRLVKSEMKCNVPRRTPGHKTKSHVVKACSGGEEKIIRFGQQGVSGSPKRKDESESDRKRRESFKARHSKNIAKGKMSAAYWSNVTKW